MLPFSVDQFFEVFARYNVAIWPLHLVAYALAAVVLWSILTRQTWSFRAAMLLLGILWLWNGLAYHLTFFAPINPAAYAFAGLFVAQGTLFLGFAARQNGISLTPANDWPTVVATGFIIYALAIYSALGAILGHGWPAAPMFGVAPCPTTIFTLGLMMLARPSLPLWLSVIPLVWALIGATAAMLLGVPEDLGLLASAFALLVMLVLQRHARPASSRFPTSRSGVLIEALRVRIVRSSQQQGVARTHRRPRKP